jgi:protocatechuate 3,4-dioxygenase beta subunit
VSITQTIKKIARWGSNSRALDGKRPRRIAVEPLEPRQLMAADIRVGAVYIEKDQGTDMEPDRFYVSFEGGAENTQLRRLVLNADLYERGLSRGDLIFDTAPGGLGADHWHPFQIVQMEARNSNATVKATVVDGSSQLVLEFTNFVAGDRLIFSIDVDEVVYLSPGETNIDRINEGVDPITSGVEFQETLLTAEFSAPHYEDIAGSERFLNFYDSMLDPLQLRLPKDNEIGLRDRTTGVGLSLRQKPKPVSISGTVWVDSNENLSIESGERRLAGVNLELWALNGSQYVATGHRTVTDGQGRYRFGTDLGLLPGTYQVRQTQPQGYYSVGATAGRLVSGGAVGRPETNNPDVLTQISIPKGDSHAIELNFAENLPSTLGGHVCYVVSGMDCFSEQSEKAPQANVLIELLDSSGRVLATTRTAADGSYRFENLRAGNYSLRQQNASGRIDGAAKAGSGGGNVLDPNTITQIIVGGGSSLVDYDFCDLVPAEVSGNVYYDANNNGSKDSGEAPLADVLVRLWDDSGNMVASTRTNAQGYYAFQNLRPGNYRVTEQTPPGYLPGRASVGSLGGQTDASGDVISAIRLGSGAKGIHYDFGELLPGTIQGRVIVDVNGNCIIDAQGEMPLSGVRIELLDRLGTLVASTMTDTDGRYRFEGLAPNTYSVRQTPVSGYFHGGQKAGSGGGNDSVDYWISSILVQPGASLVDYDFCAVPPGSLSGSVYVDHNQNCLREEDEPPIAGVTITLVDAAGTVVATTTTDSQGRYSFTGLRAGNYSVRQMQPAGYLQGGQRAGSGGGDDSLQDVISAIVLGAGAQLVEYNFCELLPGSISGNVYSDLNLNCVREADERGLSGVRVDLLDSAGSLVATTVTDADGNYRFGNLVPGRYSVREHQPEGFFQGGQTAPSTGGDDTVADRISDIDVGSGQDITDANFCEIEPGRISGYVFQDGPVIRAVFGQMPDNVRDLRDGNRTPDDKPIAGVRIRLMLPDGSPAPSSLALPGFYDGEFIEASTDAEGYYQFVGLPPGIYHLFQSHPTDYIDWIDTPGSTGGFTLDKPEQIDQMFEQLDGDIGDLGNYPREQLLDAIFVVTLMPGVHSVENNFSEILVEPETPVPPVDRPQPPLERPLFSPELFPGVQPIQWQPLLWSPLPLIVGGGHLPEMTWHLSVVNGGAPRGARNGEEISPRTLAENTDHIDFRTWTVRGLKTSNYRYISNRLDATALENTQSVFYIPEAIPLMGDFNGDGYDELCLFLDGEWFIDINGNGRWDEQDIWLKLGSKQDQPVVGDWDGDGKEDIGVFGRKWQGDERALAHEPGMPDPQNFVRTERPKNMPRHKDETPDTPRIMQPARDGRPRADVIDHVFRFGGAKEIAVAGDFNGDGITTVGTFRDGKWKLDTTGNGHPDTTVELGAPGDLPLVGDFNGDGIDELAIIRGNQVLVDSNANGKIDATDQVFLLDSADGTVIVGDFDGDGKETPALYQSPEQRNLQARRHAG